MVYSTSSIALSDTSYLLDFVELVQRLDRGQRVDVEALDLVADLHQHGIVELEHRQLHVLRPGALGGLLHGLRRGFAAPLLEAAARHDLVVAGYAESRPPARRSTPACRPCGPRGYRTNAPCRRARACAGRRSGCPSP